MTTTRSMLRVSARIILELCLAFIAVAACAALFQGVRALGHLIAGGS